MPNWLLNLLCKHPSWHIPVNEYGPAPFKACDRCGYEKPRTEADQGVPAKTW